MTLLSSYAQPNAKIHALINEGSLQSLRKGLYMAGPALGVDLKPEPFLVANHILGPSYVSLETALAYHGIIPERVFEISSMTTKSSRKFTTPLGVFTYTRLALPYYAYGIDSVRLGDNQFSLIASPEKALFDKVITTGGLIFRSRKSVHEFLLENMRMDENILRKLDIETMETWIGSSLKQESLIMMTKALKDL